MTAAIRATKGVYFSKILRGRGYFQNFSGQGVYPLPPIPYPRYIHV